MLHHNPDQIMREIEGKLKALSHLIRKVKNHKRWRHGATQEYIQGVELAFAQLDAISMPRLYGDNKAWEQAYTALLDALMQPQLSEQWKGSPAYYLRNIYHRFAKLNHALVTLFGAWSNQRVKSETTTYFVAAETRLTWSLWWTWLARRTILPFLLVWDFTCWLGNYLFGKMVVTWLIVRSLGVKDWRLIRQDLGNIEDLDDYFAKALPDDLVSRQYHIVDGDLVLHCRVCCFKSMLTDDDSLEAMLRPDGRIKTIVVMLGNYNIYQHSVAAIKDDMEAFARDNVPVRIILWHYPGVFSSFGSPTRPADLAKSGLTLIQHLLDCGIKPKTMTLKGHSLGGYIATHVTYCCHNLKLWVRLWSDRSLSDAPNYVMAKAVTQYDSGFRPRPWVITVLFYFFYPFAWLLVRLLGCQMPSAYYITQLRRRYVDYILVRSSEEARGRKDIRVKDDSVIQDLASLDQSWWFRWWTKRNKIFSLPQHLYHFAGNLEEDAHSAPLKELIPTYLKHRENAQMRFVHFVKGDPRGVASVIKEEGS